VVYGLIVAVLVFQCILSYSFPHVIHVSFRLKRLLEQAQPSMAKKLKVGVAPKDSGEWSTFLSMVLCNPYVELLGD